MFLYEPVLVSVGMDNTISIAYFCLKFNVIEDITAQPHKRESP